MIIYYHDKFGAHKAEFDHCDCDKGVYFTNGDFAKWGTLSLTDKPDYYSLSHDDIHRLTESKKSYCKWKKERRKYRNIRYVVFNGDNNKEFRNFQKAKRYMKTTGADRLIMNVDKKLSSHYEKAHVDIIGNTVYYDGFTSSQVKDLL